MTNYVIQTKRINLLGYGESSSIVSFKTKNPLGADALEVTKSGHYIVLSIPEAEDDMVHEHNGYPALGTDGWNEYTYIKVQLVFPFGVQEYSHDSYGSGAQSGPVGGRVADPSIPPFAGYQAQAPWEQSIQPHNGKVLRYNRAIPVTDGNFVYYIYLLEYQVPLAYDPFPEGEEPPVIPPYTPPGLPGIGG
jgi:hypothetical protein